MSRLESVDAKRIPPRKTVWTTDHDIVTEFRSGQLTKIVGDSYRFESAVRSGNLYTLVFRKIKRIK
jgi:hypothetical protein